MNLRRSLILQVVEAVLWGGFFSVAPLEVLILGAPGWVLALVYRERALAARPGHRSGLGLRAGVVVALVAVAVVLPIKYDDVRVGPLARADPSLGELAAMRLIRSRLLEHQESVRIRVPSMRPTRRELREAISGQTGFRVVVRRCGSGANVLFGRSGGPIRVEPAAHGSGTTLKN